MRAAVYHAPFDITAGDRPDPVLQVDGDAVVDVLAGCVCGSDLWFYRGINTRPEGSIGHEFVGVVREVGSAVTAVRVGDVVIAPFTWSCGECVHCLAGVTTSCVVGGIWGRAEADGGQGAAVRVPYANGTLVPVPGVSRDDLADDARLADLLALSDVMGTGHHAAVSARVRPGSTVVVVGDGAVGLCGVAAAVRLGAARVISLSRNPARQAVARTLGATEIIDSRGEQAVADVLAATNGVGADAVLECVGTDESMRTAIAVARPGSCVGYVGVPHGVVLDTGMMFSRNVSVCGGVASVRTYIPELLTDVLAGRLHPGVVFDEVVGLEQVDRAYELMHTRAAIKVMVRP